MTNQHKANRVRIDEILAEGRNRPEIMGLEEVRKIIALPPKRRKGIHWSRLFLLLFFLLAGVLTFTVWQQQDREKVGTQERSALNSNTEGQIGQPGSVDENPETQWTEGASTEEHSAMNRAEAERTPTQRQPNPNTPMDESVQNSRGASGREMGTAGNENPRDLYAAPSKWTLKGWTLRSKNPKGFAHGLERDEVYEGGASAYVRADKSSYGSAWLTQEISAAPFVGKRVRFSAMVMCRDASKKPWAGIFINVKGKDFKAVGFDNLYTKKVAANAVWVPCEVIMDVPEGSRSIHFGLYKVYGGKAWIDDVSLEVVSDETPLHFTTQTEASDTSLTQPDLSELVAGMVVRKPSNLDFEQSTKQMLPQGWHLGEEKQHVRGIVDEKVQRNGQASALLQSTGYVPNDQNALMQYCRVDDYEGQRLKITAWVRSKDLKEHASFFFRVQGINAQSPTNISEKTFTGTNDWTRVELELDIPEGATYMTYGLMLTGGGMVWMDDLSIERVNLPNKVETRFKAPVNLGFEE